MKNIVTVYQLSTCDPSLASEPSFAASSESNSDAGETTYSLVSADATPNSLPKDKALFVPTPPKRMKKEAYTSLLKDAVTAFNRFASKDPLNGMVEFLKEENERNREHKRRMMEMQMQIYQTMIATFRNQEQGHMVPHQQVRFFLKDNTKAMKIHRYLIRIN